jgi:hypothetical protein
MQNQPQSNMHTFSLFHNPDRGQHHETTKHSGSLTSTWFQSIAARDKSVRKGIAEGGHSVNAKWIYMSHLLRLEEACNSTACNCKTKILRWWEHFCAIRQYSQSNQESSISYKTFRHIQLALLLLLGMAYALCWNLFQNCRPSFVNNDPYNCVSHFKRNTNNLNALPADRYL